MGRGKALTDLEKGMILAAVAHCCSQREIAETIGRSRTVVQNFLKNPEKYNNNYKGSNNRKITPAAKRRLLRSASNSRNSSRELRDSLQLPVSVRRVQQILQNDPNLIYKRMRKVPMMTENHKLERVKWARDKMTYSIEQWKDVMFSDEKKFNLDGPDGFACYWHDLNKDEITFSRRQNGGDSVMLWAACTYYGVSNLMICRGKMDSKKYCDILTKEMLPFAADTLGERFTFQQDGASIHRSAFNTSFLSSRNVSVLPWPAKSPDLNIMENIWGLLSRRVYAQQRQFENLGELTECIVNCWNELSDDYLKALYESLQERCIQVVEKKGEMTKY